MKPTAYLEHNNITVKNIDATIHFLRTAMPEFKLRGEGIHNGRKWVHFGTDHSYLAINEIPDTNPDRERYDDIGFNHMGFVVGDVEAVGKRLASAGFKRSYPLTVQKFRIRDYFLDNDGNEYEFVQYLSEIAEQRNSYAD